MIMKLPAHRGACRMRSRSKRRLISAVGAESKISAQISLTVAAPDTTFLHRATFLVKNHAASFTNENGITPLDPENRDKKETQIAVNPF